jgi:fucose 4-O-acetylase-like acetyltransferase
MCLGVASALHHYPFTAVEDGTGMIWLPYEILIVTVQPALFALAMTQCPLDMAWWGSTTLGCYVFHFYFRKRMFQLVLAMVSACAFDPSGFVLFAMILAVCISVQTTVGPLGNYILMVLKWLLESGMELVRRPLTAHAENCS